MRKLERYREVIHPLFAVLMPASFLIPFSALLSNATEGKIPNLFTATMLTLATGFTTVLLGNIARDERAGIVSRLRELIIILALSYLGASLLRSVPIGIRFKPSLNNVPHSLLVAIQWLSSAAIQSALRSREMFIQEIEGKDGIALQNAVRDAATLSQDALAGLTTLRSLPVVFAVILCITWIVVEAFGLATNKAVLFASLPCFFILPLMLALSNLYSFEHEVVGMGLAFDERTRSRRLRFSFLIVGISFALALLVSANASLLPPRWIISFLDWLFSFIKMKPSEHLPVQDFQSNNDALGELIKQLNQNQDATTHLDLTKFFAVLRNIALAVAAGLLLWFLISPLTSKYFRSAVRRRSLLLFLKRKARQLFELFRWKREKDDQKQFVDPNNLKPIREALEKIADKKTSKEKRREIGRMTRAFLRLILWGEKRSFPYGLTTAPGEYTRTLAAAIPELSDALLAGGDLFEEALYSAHTLEVKRTLAYESAIRDILHYEASRQT